MKKRSFIFLLPFLFIVFKSSSQNFQITQLKLEFIGNQLQITYNIDNQSSSNKFHVSIEITRQSGEFITPKSITGDLGDNIKAGNNKKIIWDLGRDSIYLDEDISIEIKGEMAKVTEVVESYGKGSLFLRSMVFPGWGQTKMTGKPWWLVGIATYGALAGGFIVNKNSQNEYDSYLGEDNPATRADLYDKAQKKLTMANTLFVTSATLWVANIIWVAIAPDNNMLPKHAKVYLKPVSFPDKDRIMVSLRVDF